MKTIILFLIPSIILLIVGYVFTNSIKFNICIVNETVTEAACINKFERIGDPLFYGMGALTLVFLVLLSAQQAIPAWKKFAKWFIPLAALVFIFYSEPGSGNYFAPYPEQVFKWLSGLYVVISFWIIGRVVLNQKNPSN
ncbi:MAG: hypothetical protein WBL19_01700 [Minisyncoccia bacterium]